MIAHGSGVNSQALTVRMYVLQDGRADVLVGDVPVENSSTGASKPPHPIYRR
jgi:hypothetical protein